VEVVQGELVVTTLNREATPLLRYQTRVAGQISPDKCPCGRTGMVIVPGERLDCRWLVNETPLYQNQIADVLAQTELAGHLLDIAARERHVVISVQLTEALLSDTIWRLENLQRKTEAEFLARLGIPAKVRFVASPRARQDQS
jgi:phenylacetate-CoA ligase